MFKVISLVMCFFLTSTCFSQITTVGLISFDNRVSDGYTLLSTHHSTTTYLIDNCGFVVHSWESDYYPGVTVKLLSNGDLLRATKYNSEFFIHGGAGGRIELLNWDGSIKWEFNYASSEYRHHHDVHEMDNGNFLILAWDKHTRSDAILAGRDPALIGTDDDDIWGEHIIEVKPLDNNGFEIVWEWYVWDHLVQEYDNTKNNYGSVADSPELIDLNLISSEIDGPDIVHANGFSYSETLDQIIISSRNYNEFWIIDHSTSTEEAKGHIGGAHEKGGDLIYRYGNPQAYSQGTIEDKKLFGQHNVRWTGSDTKVMLFNNGYEREGEVYSSVDFLELPMVDDKYVVDDEGTYGPNDFDRTYKSTDIQGFEFSGFISGAVELENNNILICSGAVGTLVEITPDGEPVWNYINPITSNGIVEQGYSFIDNQSTRNLVFRAYKYPMDYGAFSNINLTPIDRIELGAFESYPCIDVVASIETNLLPSLSVFPNPVSTQLNILAENNLIASEVVIVDRLGKKMNLGNIELFNNILTIDVGHFIEGVYVVTLFVNGKIVSYKFMVI